MYEVFGLPFKEFVTFARFGCRIANVVWLSPPEASCLKEDVYLGDATMTLMDLLPTVREGAREEVWESANVPSQCISQSINMPYVVSVSARGKGADPAPFSCQHYNMSTKRPPSAWFSGCSPLLQCGRHR